MSWEYDNYLYEHRENVKKGVEWMLQNLEWIQLDQVLVSDLYALVKSHDASKNTQEEYEAYDAYFYGSNKSYQVVQDFNRAWLMHIHHNPHHWQHWVLLEDDPDGGNVCIEMPMKYVIEMIADWWSFSWKTDNLYEIFDWYEKHKPTIQFHSNTREVVEHILKKIKEKLDEQHIESDINGD